MHHSTGSTPTPAPLMRVSQDTLREARARLNTMPALFDWRGVMCTLRQGPTDQRLLRRYIDVIADHGANVLQIEVDAAVRYDSHPEIAADWAMTRDDLRSHVRYARDRGLEVIPLLPTLHHAAYILRKHPEFREHPDSISTCCPSNGACRRFCFDLMDELIELFDARYLHITHDEVVWDYNLMKRRPLFTCARCRSQRPADLFAHDIECYRDHLAGIGCQTILWADGLLNPYDFDGPREMYCYGGPPDHLAEALPRIHRDVILQVWNYQPIPRFPHIDHLLNAGFRVVGASSRGRNNYLMAAYLAGIDHPRRLGMIHTNWRQIIEDHADDMIDEARLGALCAYDYRLLHDHHDPWVDAVEERRRITSPLLGLGVGEHAVSLDMSDAPIFSEGYLGRMRDDQPGMLVKPGRFYSIEFKVQAVATGCFASARVETRGHRDCEPSIQLNIHGQWVAARQRIQHGQPLDLTPWVQGLNRFVIRLAGLNQAPATVSCLDGVGLACVIEAARPA